jgi:hypothetical protein
MGKRRLFSLLLLTVLLVGLLLSGCRETYYTLTVSIEGGGTVTPMSGKYKAGTVVELEVDSEPGWGFYQWSGDSHGIVNNKVIMDRDKHIIAEFRGYLRFSASQRIGKKPCTITFTTSTDYPEPEKLTYQWEPNIPLFGESRRFTGSATETYTYDEWNYIFARCRATGPENYTAGGGAYIWLDPAYDSSSTYGVAPLPVLFFPKDIPMFDFSFRSFNYSWSFGDGQIKDNGSSQENHIFHEPGIYTVTVRISDKTGASESVTKSVCVFNGVLKTLSPTGTHILHNYAYLAVGDGGLQIVDLSNLANPQVVKTVNTPGSAEAVYVLGNYAYVADDAMGLQVIDISDPFNALIVGSSNTPRSAKEIYVSNQYAYIADGDYGLQIVNVANAASPSHVSTLELPGFAKDVYVIDNYAYAACGTGGLQIVSISDPATPFIVGSVKIESEDTLCIFVKDHYCYTAGSGGFSVIDVSNPSAPGLVARLPFTQAQKVSIYGDYAYVINADDFLFVIDLSSPVNPITTASVKMPKGLRDIYIYSNQIYIADRQGLIITRVFE